MRFNKPYRTAGKRRRASQWQTAMALMTVCLTGMNAMADYEKPRYTVEGAVAKDVELRAYEPMLLAEVTVTGDRSTASGRAFRILAGFIFGRNTTREKVAMTAPVTQTQVESDVSPGEGVWRVNFMMPSEFTEATLPVPDDERIRVYATGPYRAVALRFSGRHSDSNFNAHIEELRNLARERSLNIAGEPILAYYNAPFSLPFTRRNEVMFVLDD